MTSAVAVLPRGRPALADNPFRWDYAAWFAVVHVFGVVAVREIAHGRVDERTLWMAGIQFFLCHLSITMGPHRLYTHNSYWAPRALHIVLLVFFAGTMQSSALWWVAHHMRHHKYEDTVLDSYSVLHGLWWAHMGWLHRTTNTPPPAEAAFVLRKHPHLAWWHRHYYPVAIPMSLLLPAALAACWGDALNGLLVGGFLRLMVQYHGTWCINSLAHWKWAGSRLYAGATACVCWPLFPVTVGEWNHAAHHVAEEDYRLGNRRWYHPDPGKWVIYSLSLVGVTKDLRRVSDEDLLARIQARVANANRPAAAAA